MRLWGVRREGKRQLWSRVTDLDVTGQGLGQGAEAGRRKNSEVGRCANKESSEARATRPTARWQGAKGAERLVRGS